jgi:hypothetical protein
MRQLKHLIHQGRRLQQVQRIGVYKSLPEPRASSSPSRCRSKLAVGALALEVVGPGEPYMRLQLDSCHQEHRVNGSWLSRYTSS